VWSALNVAARSLRERLATTPTIAEKVSLVLAHDSFGAVQQPIEITRLLEELVVRQPRAVCEIGGANGGTLALFCQVASDDAVLLSIDLAYSWPRRLACRSLARAGQTVHCLSGDSHDESTREKLLALLRDRPLDFLLIDGDHSLAGVEQDYQMYGSLVRPGGFIAFHDIVPDHSLRHGTPSAAVVGGVPEFWRGVRETGLSRELVGDPDQDGYGLGILTVGRDTG
jgi:predicted O-methyltransferase YrrM